MFDVPAPTNILLVDDDAELRSMLCEYLADEGFTVAVAGNGEEAIRSALAGGYAAIILDIMLPRVNGVEVLRRVRQQSEVPIIMLTARGSDVDRVVGLELGADDYVAKPCNPRELVARLRAVLRRTKGAKPVGAVAIGDLSLDRALREARWESQQIELTATEFNLLEVLLRSGSAVTSKDELSLIALGRQRQRYDRSIDVHVSNLRQKLERVSAGAATIETIRGVGYRLRCPA